jgi:hypothetical protein
MASRTDHYNVWLSSIIHNMFRMWKINVATVFTTHATMLGREVTQQILNIINAG